MPEHIQRKVKHVVMAAVITATTVLSGYMLKLLHAAPHRPHHPPNSMSERRAGQVRRQQHRSHGHRHIRG